MRVPSWRTRIFPARTVSPPNTFTPRLWPLLSRPLRELPPAFLCAIAALPGSPFDSDNFQRCLILPVARLPAVAFASLLLENDDLLRAILTDDLAGNFRIGHERCADFRLSVAT